MAKEKVKQEDEGVVLQPDFVQLVKDAVPAMGMSQFVRANLDTTVDAAGLQALNDEYASQGYEVFANGKSILLLKQ